MRAAAHLINDCAAAVGRITAAPAVRDVRHSLGVLAASVPALLAAAAAEDDRLWRAGGAAASSSGRAGSVTAEAERLLAAAVDVRPGPVVDLTDAQLDLLISWVDRVIAVAATRDVARLLDAVGEVPTDGEVGPRLVLTEAMDVVSAEACEALGRAADWGDDTAARLVGEAGQWLAVLAMLTAADSID